MSESSLLNSPNVKLNGNLILQGQNTYIQFPNGTQQNTAGGGSGGDVYTNVNNTFLQSSMNTFLGDVQITGAFQVDNTQTNIGQLSGNGGEVNTSIGANSLHNITTGQANSSFGGYSLSSLTTGIDNTSCGYNGLNSCTIGSYNTAVGFSTLLDTTNGNLNTALGYQAGENNTGSNNTYLGSNATQLPTDTNSYQYLTLIGANAIPINSGQSNQVVLGRNTDNVYIPSSSINLGVSISSNLYVSGNTTFSVTPKQPALGTYPILNNTNGSATIGYVNNAIAYTLSANNSFTGNNTFGGPTQFSVTPSQPAQTYPISGNDNGSATIGYVNSAIGTPSTTIITNNCGVVSNIVGWNFNLPNIGQYLTFKCYTNNTGATSVYSSGATITNDGTSIFATGSIVLQNITIGGVNSTGYAFGNILSNGATFSIDQLAGGISCSAIATYAAGSYPLTYFAAAPCTMTIIFTKVY